MALLLVDGFDRFADVSMSTSNFSTDGVWNPPGSTVQMSWLDGRKGGKSMVFSSSTVHRRVYTVNPLIKNGSTYVVGFAIKYDSLPREENSEIAGLMDGSTFSKMLLEAGPVGAGVYGLDIAGTKYGSLAIGAWHYVELKWTQAASTTLELRVDGVTLATVASQVFPAADRSFAFSVRLLNSNFYVDDLYILDTTGATLNDFLGPQVVDYRVPKANGQTNAFTPLAGANYTNVNTSYRDDTSWNAANTIGVRDFYMIDGSSLTVKSVNAVVQHLRHSVTEEAAFAIETLTAIGSTVTAGTSLTIVPTGVIPAYGLMNTVRPGGGIISPSDINSLQIGVGITGINTA